MFCSFALAQERLAVRIPSDDETQVQDLLDIVRNAVDNEDSKSYLACMTKEMASKNKKKVVLMFMNHDMEMELHKFEIIDSNDNSLEFVVKYTIYQDSKSQDFVSHVNVEKAEDRLLISKEDVLSTNSKKPAVNDPVNFNGNKDLFPPFRNDVCENGKCPPFQNGNNACADGRCPPKKKYVPKFNEQGFEVLEGVSLFNDENGNPDPNGIMWMPPGYLFKKFPDKYGVPQCVREKMGIQ
jgi:hypothetical protein